MWVAAHVLRSKPHPLEELGDAMLAPRKKSSTIPWTRKRLRERRAEPSFAGFRELYGSWKMICISPTVRAEAADWESFGDVAARRSRCARWSGS